LLQLIDYHLINYEMFVNYPLTACKPGVNRCGKFLFRGLPAASLYHNSKQTTADGGQANKQINQTNQLKKQTK